MREDLTITAGGPHGSPRPPEHDLPAGGQAQREPGRAISSPKAGERVHFYSVFPRAFWQKPLAGKSLGVESFAILGQGSQGPSVHTVERPASLGIPERAMRSGGAGDPQGNSERAEHRYHVRPGQRKGVGLDHTDLDCNADSSVYLLCESRR